MSSKGNPFSRKDEHAYLETVICQYMPCVILKGSTFLKSGVMGEHHFDQPFHGGIHHCYFGKTVSMRSSEQK